MAKSTVLVGAPCSKPARFDFGMEEFTFVHHAIGTIPTSRDAGVLERAESIRAANSIPAVGCLRVGECTAQLPTSGSVAA